MTAKLTPAEKDVLIKLAHALNTFNALPLQYSDCLACKTEFLISIHRAQAIVALRVARRADPDFWRSKETT